MHTPDEKTTVDTTALMTDKLIEFLLTLLTAPPEDREPENHKISKSFFRSCMNYGEILSN